jgi:hypothetical protein
MKQINSIWIKSSAYSVHSLCIFKLQVAGALSTFLHLDVLKVTISHSSQKHEELDVCEKLIKLCCCSNFFELVDVLILSFLQICVLIWIELIVVLPTLFTYDFAS